MISITVGSTIATSSLNLALWSDFILIPPNIYVPFLPSSKVNDSSIPDPTLNYSNIILQCPITFISLCFPFLITFYTKSNISWWSATLIKLNS